MNSASKITLGAALLALVSVSAAADGHSEGADGSSGDSIAMAPEDIVKTRRLAYFLSTQAVGQIKAGIEEAGDLRRTQAGATMLARWAETIPTLFPEGTDLESSRALPTVWSDREGFEAAALAYKNAAEELVTQAKTGDREAANAAFMAMAGTCKSCHDKYREE